jgi:hypothetical protein
MKKLINLGLLAFAAITMLSSCKRKFDLPDKKTEVPCSGSITIDSIYGRYKAYYYDCPNCGQNGTPSKLYQFPNDLCLTATVTADEKSGNIYKTVYIKDATGTMQLKLLNGGGLAVGDLIKINLNGVKLDDYAKMVQLDSVDIEKRVTKISSGHVFTPSKATFNQINAVNSISLSVLQGAVVTLDSVEFNVGSKNVPYADAVNKESIDRTLVNYAGQSLTVRTSGYAYFASNLIPCGKLGKITAVVSQYGTTIQLIIRDVAEVKIGGGNCPYMAKNFDDNSLTSGGWSTFNVTGANYWTIGTIGGTYANASNYINGTNYACENWLISPSINLSASTNPILNFSTAKNYSGPNLDTYVSTDYVSGSPAAATWTLLPATLSPGSWAWTSSGNISLSAYKTNNVRIGFKYSGTGSAGSTWEVDNIGIIEN